MTSISKFNKKGSCFLIELYLNANYEEVNELKNWFYSYVCSLLLAPKLSLNEISRSK